jgi:ectoine hydroxylase-related dioxygenase (phytanoyl-CoA dioxygenase family)
MADAPQGDVATPTSADGIADDFSRDGIVCLRSALTAREMALVEAAYDYRLAHLTDRAAYLYEQPGTTFLTDMTNQEVWHAEPFIGLLQDTSLGELARRCFGGGEVWFYYEQIFLKEGASRRTPWHQDSSYLPIAGPAQARLWITLDPIAPEDALEFVAGSHHGTIYNTSSFSADDDTEPFDPSARLPRLPNIEAERDKWDIRSWPVKPGDVLAFHPGVLHGGAPTRAGSRRRTMTLMVIGENATFQPRHSDRDNRAEVGADQDGGFGAMRPGDPFRLPGFIRMR